MGPSDVTTAASGLAAGGASVDLSEVAGAFETVTDAIVVVDPDGTIAYGNPYMAQLLGGHVSQVVGRNIADLLHPEDLGRAIEVMSRMNDDTLGVGLTPAEYRFLRHDGTWCPIEINGSLVAPGQPSRVLAIGRYSGDHDIQNRILHRLTAGEPIASAIALVPEFGLWRHPLEHYAVLTHDRSGVGMVDGTALATRLAELAVADSPWAVAARTGEEQRTLVEQLAASLRVAAEEAGLRECWAVPVPDPNSADDAVLIAWTRVRGPAAEVHAFALEMMGRSLRLILHWGRQRADLEWAARHDALTGAVNRHRFFGLLDSLAAGPVSTVGVLFADLDGFKAVNDAHGHAVGDAVLRDVAARIRGTIVDGHVLARLGGDEFAVLCPDLTDAGEVTAAADRIVAAMKGPLAIGGRVLQVGISVGAATASTHFLEPDALVDRADRAMYAAKAAGRGCWVLAEAPARS